MPQGRRVARTLIAFFILSSPAFAEVHLWSHRFGGGGDEQSYNVTVDASRNVILTGSANGTTEFGGGPVPGGYIAKFDANGNHIWSRGFGGSYPRGVAADDSGNIIITGYFFPTVDFGGGPLTSVNGNTDDIFIAKFDPSGNHIWSQRFGAEGGDLGFEVAVDASGNITVTGLCTGAVDFGGGLRPAFGGTDIFVAKFDASGAHLWSHVFGSAGEEYGVGVAMDAGGSVVITGFTAGASLDFGGGSLPVAGGYDIFLAKFDPSGSHLWSNLFGDGSTHQVGQDVAIDPANNVVFTGSMNGTVDFGGGPRTTGSTAAYLVKFTSGGTYLWDRVFSTGSSYLAAVAVDFQGQVVLTGSFTGTVTFGGQAFTSTAYYAPFIAKFDGNGSHLWSNGFESTRWAIPEAVAVDAAGNSIITGSFQGGVTFECSTPLASAGFTDIFVAKFGLGSPAAPAPPSDLTIELLCPPQALLTWDDPSNETSIEIEVEENDSGIWSSAATLPANTTSWTSPALTYGVSYRYRVRSCACDNFPCSDWVVAVQQTVGPCIKRIVPGTVTWLDTGVDLLIEGEGFLSGAGLMIDPPGATIAANRWSDTQLHVSLDFDDSFFGSFPAGGLIDVRAANPDGRVSQVHNLTARRLAVAHPRDYAPLLWFAPEEPWLSVSPLFADRLGRTYYDDPASRNQEYLLLTGEQKRERVVVYYDIYGDDTNELPVPFPYVIGGTPCMVFEYWLHFVYDEYTECNSIVWNRHQHDWEKFFVFVGATDGAVRAIAGSAHSIDAVRFNPSNVYEFPQPIVPGPGGFHPIVLVERGGHATSPDMNGNGLFDRLTDVNGCAFIHAWGIQDGIPARQPEDRFSPTGLGTPEYRLCALDGIKAIVGLKFSDTVPASGSFWDGSREQICQYCNLATFNLFRAALGTQITFRGSQPTIPDPNGSLSRFLEGECLFPCFLEQARTFRLAHIPIEHAWEGSQARYLADPRRILPSCYCPTAPVCPGHGVEALVHGALGTVCGVATLLKRGPRQPSKVLAVEDDETPILSYFRIGDDRAIRFAGITEGLYSVQVNVEGAAPYEQTLELSTADSLLGVNGSILLVPQGQHFTLKCRVNDASGDPLQGAGVRFILEPDSLLLPTLTDSLGVAHASVDTSGTYKVAIAILGHQDSVLALRGSFGDTIVANLRTPFERWLPTNTLTPPTAMSLDFQNSPNPFNPSTVINFELPAPADVNLGIYTVGGRRIRTLVEETKGAGQHRVVWDGLDDAGNITSSGVYSARLRAGKIILSRKLVLLR